MTVYEFTKKSEWDLIGLVAGPHVTDQASRYKPRTALTSI